MRASFTMLDGQILINEVIVKRLLKVAATRAEKFSRVYFAYGEKVPEVKLLFRMVGHVETKVACKNFQTRVSVKTTRSRIINSHNYKSCFFI